MRFALLSATAVPLALFLLAAPAAAATSPQSKACSDQATAKGLHGAEREAFRADCMKSAGAAAPTKSAPAEKPAAKAKPMTETASKPTPKSASGTGGATTASKACSDQATAKGLHGAEREAFRAECMKGAPVAAKPAAPVLKPAAPVAKPVTKAAKPAAEAIPPEPRAGAAKPTAAAGSRSPAQLAADQRIKDCGQQWQSAKAANRIPAGQTWPQYWSACSARMKAAGK